MLNKLTAFCKANELLSKGDRVVCAVSGGADSMALLWAMYLLKDTYDLKLSAAHFDHGLRGEESAGDAAFVEQFCKDYGIAFFMGKGSVCSGPKGLEAAARDARYAFLQTLPGKIATAHTADDNAETVLMHLVRGTGLKGLGGIAPSRDRLIRPMLGITRQEVLDFLEQYSIPYRDDSSNATDDFLRNRLRHHVLPLLKAENPAFAENTSAMAMRLRLDDAFLEQQISHTDSVTRLRQLEPALLSRALTDFLEENGVPEPSSAHIQMVQSIVFSDNPSAAADLPGGVRIAREYDRLIRLETKPAILQQILNCPGQVVFGDVQISCAFTQEKYFQFDRFTVQPVGTVVVRSRQAGDTMRLSGGSKKLKELFVDRKIPAALRDRIPVVADDLGILGVYGFGANLDRIASNGIEINFEKR